MQSLRDSGKIVPPNSVRQVALSCNLSFPLSLKDFINTPGCPFSQCNRLHIKTITAPTSFSIAQMLDSMRIVYATADIGVQVISRETLSGADVADLDTLDVGDCSGGTTAEQDDLFDNDNFVGPNDIVIYFVQSIPGFNGCATFPSGKPGAAVDSLASRWTLAHEVGHVLGLPHITGEKDVNGNCVTPDFTRLMTGCGTSNITVTPTLSNSEISDMQASSLTVAC
jgi:hypothetical protein